MIKYEKGDVSIRDSLNKNVSQKRTGVTLTPWYRSRVKVVVTFNSISLLLRLVIRMVVSSANNIGVAISFKVLGKPLM
jgi:hypothetical protein